MTSPLLSLKAFSSSQVIFTAARKLGIAGSVDTTLVAVPVDRLETFRAAHYFKSGVFWPNKSVLMSDLQCIARCPSACMSLAALSVMKEIGKSKPITIPRVDSKPPKCSSPL